MTGIPKDVNLNVLVGTIVEAYIDELEGAEIDWEAAWGNLWERAVDEAAYFGIFIADNKTPIFPEYILDTKDVKSEVKKQLLNLIQRRIM